VVSRRVGELVSKRAEASGSHVGHMDGWVGAVVPPCSSTEGSHDQPAGLLTGVAEVDVCMR
jgi:hypothetical protein